MQPNTPNPAPSNPVPNAAPPQPGPPAAVTDMATEPVAAELVTNIPIKQQQAAPTDGLADSLPNASAEAVPAAPVQPTVAPAKMPPTVTKPKKPHTPKPWLAIFGALLVAVILAIAAYLSLRN